MRIVVIGGGISGLACAFRLHQLGLPVTLLEQSDRVGGVIQSIRQDGFLFEAGPQSFLATERLTELVGTLGLQGELLRADPRAPRYVLLHGRLHAIPLAPPALLTTSLLSLGAKLRLLSELFSRSRPPEQDESVADFVRRKFGQELLDRLVGPFVSGVYAGDAEKLSLRSALPDAYCWEKEYGSLLRGAIKSRPAKGKPRPELCSFRQGNATLVRSLAERLGESVHLNCFVESARRAKVNGKSQLDLKITHHGRIETSAADAVVVATPAQPSGRILTEVSQRFPELLGQIQYAPVAVVAEGYRREQVEHSLAGFGFLVPRRERVRLLGTVWNSSLFPGRAPEGMVSVTSFAGGATDPKLLQLPEGQIAAIVEKELAGILRISGPPVKRAVWRLTRALPQYNLGHGRILAGLCAELARFPGLFLSGNYFEGPSIGACVAQAFTIAEAVQAYLLSRS